MVDFCLNVLSGCTIQYFSEYNIKHGPSSIECLPAICGQSQLRLSNVLHLSDLILGEMAQYLRKLLY